MSSFVIAHLPNSELSALVNFLANEKINFNIGSSFSGLEPWASRQLKDEKPAGQEEEPVFNELLAEASASPDSPLFQVKAEKPDEIDSQPTYYSMEDNQDLYGELNGTVEDEEEMEQKAENYQTPSPSRSTSVETGLSRITKAKTPKISKGSKVRLSKKGGKIKLQNKTIKKKVSNQEKLLECEVCHRTFKFLGTLIYHSKVHTGERSFECETCGNSFRARHHLTRHVDNVHSGVKRERKKKSKKEISKEENEAAENA